MKNYVLRPACVLAMFFAFLGCSSDSDENKIPTKIRITQIDVDLYPTTNAGNQWDNGEDTSGSKPDVYFMLKDGPTFVYIHPDAVLDATAANLSFTLSPTFETGNLYSTFTIGLLDFDGGELAASDLMATSEFQLYDPEASSLPSVIMVNNVSQGFLATFHVSYEY